MTQSAISLLSGASAGLLVDVILYPIDTLKTRLQSGKLSKEVFRGKLFAGLPAILVGSAPGVRVPTEVIKQRVQQNPQLSVTNVFKYTLKKEFPLWEFLKKKVSVLCDTNPDNLPYPAYSMCGAIAGGISGALTTPLDVVKTRIILAERSHHLSSGSVISTLRFVYKENGWSGLFSGVIPRTTILTIGGAVFLGFFDIFKHLWTKALN